MLHARDDDSPTYIPEKGEESESGLHVWVPQRKWTPCLGPPRYPAILLNIAYIREHGGGGSL